MTSFGLKALTTIQRQVADYRDKVSGLGRNQCLLCLGPAHTTPYALCSPCDLELPHMHVACVQCGLPLARQGQTNTQREAQFCGRCLSSRPNYDRCFAALEYRAPVDKLITQLKYKAAFSNVHLLSGLMARHITQHRNDESLPDVVVPVPLHWRRQMHRGFNQCSLLAESMTKQLAPLTDQPRIAIDYGLVQRVLHTQSQAGQNEQQRRRNVRGVFAVQSNSIPKTVAVIDDVITTGATVNELATQLKRAGVKRVEIWCPARTPAPG